MSIDMSPTVGPGGRTVHARWLLIGIVGVASVLRLRGIADSVPWLDEANTWVIAREAPREIVSRLTQDASPPLYYFALHVWMQLFGSGVLAMRSLSVVAGVLLVLLTHHVGRVTSSERTGLWSAWLIATSPVQIEYSQQVRMYSLLALLALLSTYCLVRALERGGARRWCFYAGSTVALLLTHNFAFHALSAHAVIGAAARCRGRAIWPLAISAIAIALCYAPWLPSFWAQLMAPDTYAWFAETWHRSSIGYLVWLSVESLSPAGRYFPLAHSYVVSPGLVLTLVAVAFVVRGAFVAHANVRAAPRWAAAFLFVPYASAICLSLILAPHFVPGRVDQLMVSAFALLAGAGIASFDFSLPVRCVLALVPLLAALSVDPGSMRPWDGELPAGVELGGSDGELAEELLQRAGRGEWIVCTSLSRASLEYSLFRGGSEARLSSFPRSTAAHLGGQDDTILLRDLEALTRDAASVLDEAVARTMVGSCVHLVIAESAVNRPLEFAVQRSIDTRSLEAAHSPRVFVQAGTRQLLRLVSLRRRH
jgi:hypothetical protein